MSASSGRNAAALKACEVLLRFFDQIFSKGRPLTIDGHVIDHTLLNQAVQFASEATKVDEEFFIWSLEHNAWWGPNWMGYTTELHRAGRYDRQEAERIVREANVRTFNEAMIPVRYVRLLPDCDCDQSGDPDLLTHASDCAGRVGHGPSR